MTGLPADAVDPALEAAVAKELHGPTARFLYADERAAVAAAVPHIRAQERAKAADDICKAIDDAAKRQRGRYALGMFEAARTARRAARLVRGEPNA